MDRLLPCKIEPTVIDDDVLLIETIPAPPSKKGSVVATAKTEPQDENQSKPFRSILSQRLNKLLQQPMAENGKVTEDIKPLKTLLSKRLNEILLPNNSSNATTQPEPALKSILSQRFNQIIANHEAPAQVKQQETVVATQSEPSASNKRQNEDVITLDASVEAKKSKPEESNLDPEQITEMLKQKRENERRVFNQLRRQIIARIEERDQALRGWNFLMKQNELILAKIEFDHVVQKIVVNRTLEPSLTIYNKLLVKRAATADWPLQILTLQNLFELINRLNTDWVRCKGIKSFDLLNMEKGLQFGGAFVSHSEALHSDQCALIIRKEQQKFGKPLMIHRCNKCTVYLTVLRNRWKRNA